MTVILPCCFSEELLGAAEICELTAGTEVTPYWFALGSQLVCCVIQRHALKALLGQPSPHIKVCNRKKGNVYGLQQQQQQKRDNLVSSIVIRIWKTYCISLDFATLVNHCVIKRRFTAGRLSHTGPVECSYTL